MFQLVLLFARTFLLSHITTFFRCVTWTLPRLTSDTMMFCIHFVRLNPNTSRRNRRVMNSRNKKVWFPFICQPTLPLSSSSASLSSESSSLWSWNRKKRVFDCNQNWLIFMRFYAMLCCCSSFSPLCSMISRYEIVRILLYHRVKKSPVHSFHFTVCFVFYFPLLLRLQLSWQQRHLKIVAVGNNFNYTQSHLIEFWQCTELYWDWCLGMGGWGAMRVRY